MNKKDFFILLIAALLPLSIFAAENEISLRVKSGHETGSRSESAVSASINEQVLTVSFSDVTASSIVVYDATDPDTPLFTQNYSPAYSAQANLTTLPAGEYVVEIYAFDTWWIGEFEIE